MTTTRRDHPGALASCPRFRVVQPAHRISSAGTRLRFRYRFLAVTGVDTITLRETRHCSTCLGSVFKRKEQPLFSFVPTRNFPLFFFPANARSISITLHIWKNLTGHDGKLVPTNSDIYRYPSVRTGPRSISVRLSKKKEDSRDLGSRSVKSTLCISYITILLSRKNTRGVTQSSSRASHEQLPFPSLSYSSLDTQSPSLVSVT